MLENIRDLQAKIFHKNSFKYRRYFHKETTLDDKLIGIVGARGVGKTTFLIQHLKDSPLKFSQKLYISADIINISSLFEIAEEFQAQGGKLLVIDEIHKYNNFEIELKKIYDILDIQVIFSGSSAISIDNSKADLSRRVVIYSFSGLSFREFVELSDGILLPTFSLHDILTDHIDIAYELKDRFSLRQRFDEYIKYGYYPFYFEHKKNYLLKLHETINTVIEVDIPAVYPITYSSAVNLKKLVRLICESYPYTPNMNRLLEMLNMPQNYKGLYRYMGFLHRASVLNIINQKSKATNMFKKPDKIYLHNTNLHYAYCENTHIGTVRESLFASMLRSKHSLTIPKKGDFLIDDRYTVEIGGKNKTGKQIQGVTDSFLVLDDIEIGSAGRVPLWLFGFLY